MPGFIQSLPWTYVQKIVKTKKIRNLSRKFLKNRILGYLCTSSASGPHTRTKFVRVRNSGGKAQVTEIPRGLRPPQNPPGGKARVTEIPEGGFAPPDPPTTTFQKKEDFGVDGRRRNVRAKNRTDRENRMYRTQILSIVSIEGRPGFGGR